MTSAPATTPGPAAVLFDMDGTLLDSEKLWDIAMYELSLQLGRPLTDEVRQATLGNSAHGALSKLFAHTGTEPTPAAFAEAESWVVARVAGLFREDLPWLPGARDTLALVVDSGLPSALVTNTVRSLTEIALDTIGRNFFTVTVCGDEVVNPKPAPDPYLRAAALLGVDPRDCLAVEDSPTGASAAEAAGCAVLVVPSAAEVEATAARTFTESLVGISLADLHAARGVTRREARTTTGF